ncbi:MAG: sigma-70 family RNA polymerase sigma factor [Bacteroidales bacterium]|nr:sigma-70 family RNA polymerase sigma factor [Bacteroidales bacterium]
MTRKEITQFYKEHHRRLYNIAWRILRDSGEAEEVMQDTILKFVSEERTFASDAQVSAWLARTCIRAAIDRLRRRHREADFLAEYGSLGQESSYEDTAIDPLPSIGEIRAAMDALPEPYRLVLNLVLIEGLDYEEIAGLTGRKETTLRSLFSRGRAKLAESLRKKI